jgi:hypothetical protein
MPGEVITEPNPPAAKSQLSDSLSALEVKFEKVTLDAKTAKSLSEFRRAANYIAAGELYFQMERQCHGMTIRSFYAWCSLDET